MIDIHPVVLWASGIAWLVLACIGFLSSIIALMAVVRYKSSFHGTDITLVALICAFVLNSIFVISVPAFVVVVRNSTWSFELCTFYVCMSLMCRTAEILTITCLAIQWIVYVRLLTEKDQHKTTTAVQWTSVSIWTCSIVVGILPAIGATDEEFYGKYDYYCRLLPYEMGSGFAVYLVVLSISAFVIILISICDASLFLRHIKQTATDKYQGGRFYLPPSASAFRPRTRIVHDKLATFRFSTDLSRLVLLVASLALGINHLPFAAIEIYQLFYPTNSVLLEFVSLWLLTTELLVLPPVIWLACRRYRCALVYLWKVYVSRTTAADEVPSPTLRAFGPPRFRQNGTAMRQFMEETPQEETEKRQKIITGNGSACTGQQTTHTAVISRSGLKEITVPEREVTLHVVTATVENNGSIVELKECVEIETPKRNGKQSSFRKILSKKVEDDDNKSRSRNSSGSSSSHGNKKTAAALPERGDSKRSNKSRDEWREQMRRKHLPAIFVNDAFETEEGATACIVRAESSNASVLRSSHRKSGSNASLYYMSGEFHPDNLTNSLPRQEESMQSEDESESGSTKYESEDRNNVINKQPSVSDDEREIERLAETKEIFIGFAPESVSTISSGHSSFDENRRPVWPNTAESKPPLYTNKETDTSALNCSNSPMSNSSPVPPSELDTIYIHNVNGFAVSSCTSPNSSIHFDEDVDRGFEEALAIGYASVDENNYPVFNGASNFETIREETEGSSTPGSETNPFELALQDDTGSELSFNTKAIISRRRPRRSSSEDSDNPFDKVPLKNKLQTQPESSKVKTSDANSDTGNDLSIQENGVENGIDTQNGVWTDYSSGLIEIDVTDELDDVFQPSSVQTRANAWPRDDDKMSHSDMSFDSDFSDLKLDDINSVTENGELDSNGIHCNGNLSNAKDVRNFPNRSKLYIVEDERRPTFDVEPVYF